MRRWRFLVLTVALAGPTPGWAQSPPAGLDACVLAYNEVRGATRYQVTIDWGDIGAYSSFDRLDIGVSDASGVIWPQLRNNRLRPSRTPTVQAIVETGSQYPLTFSLIGLSREAVTQFTADSASGFNSIEPSAAGVSILSPPTPPIYKPNDASKLCTSSTP